MFVGLREQGAKGASQRLYELNRKIKQLWLTFKTSF